MNDNFFKQKIRVDACLLIRFLVMCALNNDQTFKDLQPCVSPTKDMRERVL